RDFHVTGVQTCALPISRGLFGHLLGAIRGTSQYRKSTFLLNALGETVFPEFVDIEEDPFIPRGLGSAPFDAEGVAPQRRMLVEQIGRASCRERASDERV